MSILLELDDVEARRQAMREDLGATTTTKDGLARSCNGKTVHAVGLVADVTGRGDELIVLLDVHGEVLTCPLTRVRGRAMDETVAQVTPWRKGERVEVTGTLVWPSFDEALRIEILTAARAPA